MSRKHTSKRTRAKPKAVLRLPDLDQAKSAVLNSLTSSDAQRGYRHAIDEFVDWYCSEPRLASFHPHNLAQKSEVMIEHFRAFTRHRIGGRAKAMVVTGSRAHAVRYKQEFDKYLAERGYTNIKTLVAFSG